MSTQEEFKELVNYKGQGEVMFWTDYLLHRADLNSHKLKNFHCQFESFDSHLGGLATGEVVVISGKRKNGKTLFAESWIRSMTKVDPFAKAVIFSYEVQTEQLLVKYIKDDQAIPLYVPKDLKTMDFEWLMKRCLEAKLKYDAKIVLIDHLHFMVDMNTKQNMSLNIGAFMRRLKQDVAIGLNMGVILIAHQGQLGSDRSASIDTIRDSSFISQECDSVIIVHRKKNYNEVEMFDFKQAYGEQKGNLVELGKNNESEFSCGLAIVEISCSRRTGVFEFKKLFKKNGEFLEEV